MSFGEIFSKSWREYKLNFKQISKFILIFIGIPPLVLSIISIFIVLSNADLRLLALNNIPEQSYEFFPSSVSYFIFMLLGSLILIVLYLFVQGSLTSSFLKYKSFYFNNLVDSGKKSFWKYLTFTIVSIFFLGLLTLLLIIPGVIFFFYWIFGVYILFDQKTGIMESLKRSRKLVKGRWWRVFGYSILLFLILITFSIVINVAFSIFLIPFYITGFLSNTLLQDPISPSFFAAKQIINVLIQIATNLLVLPLCVLFYKNFYLLLKKSKK